MYVCDCVSEKKIESGDKQFFNTTNDCRDQQSHLIVRFLGPDGQSEQGRAKMTSWRGMIMLQLEYHWVSFHSLFSFIGSTAEIVV